MPVSLSANEMAMIERAAAPLDLDRRAAFIGAVLAALEGCPEFGSRSCPQSDPRDAAAVLGPAADARQRPSESPCEIEARFRSADPGFGSEVTRGLLVCRAFGAQPRGDSGAFPRPRQCYMRDRLPGVSWEGPVQVTCEARSDSSPAPGTGNQRGDTMPVRRRSRHRCCRAASWRRRWVSVGRCPR